MVNIKSAKKRIKINKRNRIQNNSYKSIIKTYIKKYFVTLQQYINNPNNENFISLTNSLTLVFSKLDKAKKKNILHINNVARKKSRLSKLFNFKILQLIFISFNKK